jgi:hypothetical protein
MNSNQIAELRGQIGRMNILAISGGRTEIRDGALHLAVSSGYRVVIELDEARDLYNVERIMIRGAKTFRKGRVEGVYADEVGEVAYEAGMYKSFDFGGVAAR